MKNRRLEQEINALERAIEACEEVLQIWHRKLYFLKKTRAKRLENQAGEEEEKEAS